jgi:hypothetical protein
MTPSIKPRIVKPMGVCLAVDVEALSGEVDAIPLALSFVLIGNEGIILPENLYAVVAEGFDTTDPSTVDFWNNKGRNPNPHGPALLEEYRKHARPAKEVAQEILVFFNTIVAKYGPIRLLGDNGIYDIGEMLGNLLARFTSERRRTRVILGGDRGYNANDDTDSYMGGMKDFAAVAFADGKFQLDGRLVTVKQIEQEVEAEFELAWPVVLPPPLLSIKHDCQYDAARIAYVFINTRNRILRSALAPMTAHSL